MVDKEPIQTPLFDIEPAPVAGPVTPDIAPNPGQMSHDYNEPTATQRFVEETGGGSRETLAADPPIPRKKRVSTRPIENRFTGYRGDFEAELQAGKDYEAKRGSEGPAVPINVEASELVQNTLTTIRARSIARKSGGDEKTAQALDQARPQP